MSDLIAGDGTFKTPPEDTRIERLLLDLESLTEGDLRQMDAHIDKTRRYIGQLLRMRTIIAARLGVKTPRKGKRLSGADKVESNGSGRVSEGGRAYRTKAQIEKERRDLATILLNGAKHNGALASRTGLTSSHVAYLMNGHEWFTKSEQGYHLTPAGRQAVSDV